MPQLLIRIVLTTGPPHCGCRAFSVAEHYIDGSIRVTVYLFPPHVKDPELIAHEFEHALEQADGLNLKALVNIKGSGVYQSREEYFETLRARRAGNTVSNEFFSHREGN